MRIRSYRRYSARKHYPMKGGGKRHTHGYDSLARLAIRAAILRNKVFINWVVSMEEKRYIRSAEALTRCAKV